MAVSLSDGEVVIDCDTAFDGVGALNDEAFIQGAGSVGLKTSNATNNFIAVDSIDVLGASAPYDFSDATGNAAGWHILIWFNTFSTPDPTDGARIYVGDAGLADFGYWYVPFNATYTGGFQGRVINPAVDFDENTGFDATSNPNQLVGIDEMGGGIHTPGPGQRERWKV